MLFVSVGFPAGNQPPEADIEDLLDPAVFDALVRESYKAELKLNLSIPRIVRRYEAAFAAAGLEFHKTRPARLLLAKMAKEPEKVMPQAAAERFERPFARLAEAHAKIAARAEPFI